MYYRVVRILFWFWLGLGIVIGSAASGFVGLIGGVLVGFTLGTAMVKTFREMRAEARPYGGIKANYSQKAKQRQFRHHTGGRYSGYVRMTSDPVVAKRRQR